ncbi:MAG: hypothetical protein AAB906_04675, partial [Patescibacteria group bacterium]
MAGCGKTTQIYALISSLLSKEKLNGDSIYNFKYDSFEFDNKTYFYKESQYIFEFNPIEMFNNDFIFIQQFLIDYIIKYNKQLLSNKHGQ